MDYISEVWGDGKYEYGGYYCMLINCFKGEKCLGQKRFYIKTNLKRYELNTGLNQNALSWIYNNHKENTRIVVQEQIVIMEE